MGVNERYDLAFLYRLFSWGERCCTSYFTRLGFQQPNLSTRFNVVDPQLPQTCQEQVMSTSRQSSPRSLSLISRRYAQIDLERANLSANLSHNNVTNRLLLIQKYRNLSLKESGDLYKSAKALAVFAPIDAVDCLGGGSKNPKQAAKHLIKLSQYKNLKRNTVNDWTWQIPKCPCCQQEVPSTYAHWLVVPYWVSYGFIRVCRDCMHQYQDGKDCIHVYYGQFMACLRELTDEYGYDIANKIAHTIFKPYLDKGMVHDVQDPLHVDAARAYMQSVVSQLSNSMV